MKQYLALALAALLLVGTLASCVQADPNAIDDYTPDIDYMVDKEGNTFYFEETEGEGAILVKYVGKSTKDDRVKIPARFVVESQGIDRTVVGIGDNVFRGLASVVAVEIPATVTSIGSQAFAGCTNLTSITFPNGMLSIGSQAFANCDKLASVSFGQSLESIGDHAFWHCTALTAAELPQTLKTIGAGAFYHCTTLQSVNFPAGLESVGTLAFCNCLSLPEGVEDTLPATAKKGDFLFVIDEELLTTEAPTDPSEEPAE